MGVYHKFSLEGMNSNVNPLLLKGGETILAKNVSIDEIGKWKKRKGWHKGG